MSTTESVDRLAKVREALDGSEGWIVGGAVRDWILGRPVSDLDIVVAGDPEEAARAIGKSLGAPVFPLSDEFGAWRVVVDGGDWQVDASPLAGSSINEDLRQRDFTINAIAQPLKGGDLIDPLGGAKDIEAGIVRMVSLAAFESDPLRVLRLARFSCELSFAAEPQTVSTAAGSAGGLADVAGERIFHELTRIVCSDRPAEGISLLEETEALRQVLPEIDDLRGVEQSDYHHLDVHDHTFEVLSRLIALCEDPARLGGAGPAAIDFLCQPLGDGLSRLDALRFAALLHDAAKPQTRTVFDGGKVGFPGHDELGAQMTRAAFTRLKTSSKVREAIATAVAHHLDAGFLVRQAPLDKRTVHGYLKACGGLAVDVTVLSAADRLATRGRGSEIAIERHMEVAAVLLAAAVEREAEGLSEPLIRGDLIASVLGIEHGPQLGLAVSELEAAQYAGEVTTPDEAATHLRAWLVGATGE